MKAFSRIDRSDFERLSDRDRWSAGEAANLIVNTQMEIEGSFNKQYWRDEAYKRFRQIIEVELLQWRNDGVLNFYGPSGDLAQTLSIDSEVMAPLDEDNYGVDPKRVFLLKKEILALIKNHDSKAYRRIVGLMDGKYWKEPSVHIDEKILAQTVARRIIEKEEMLPTIDSIIKELELLGIGSEQGKTTMYDWIGEIYPK